MTLATITEAEARRIGQPTTVWSMLRPHAVARQMPVSRLAMAILAAVVEANRVSDVLGDGIDAPGARSWPKAEVPRNV